MSYYMHLPFPIPNTSTHLIDPTDVLLSFKSQNLDS